MVPSILIGALLVVFAIPTLLPAAAACHEGSFVRGTPQDTEVVGVGNTSVGVYVIHQSWREDAGSSGCEGSTWFQKCPSTESVPVADVPPVVVPEIRVLGITVVPQTVVWSGGPVSAPVPDDDCLVTPAYVGVYADQTRVGTNWIVYDPQGTDYAIYLTP